MSARLSKRLLAVGDLVLEGEPMADIGTDHAALPVWLVEHGRVPRAIAIDLADGPLAAARARAPELDAVEVRAGSGLSPLRPGEVATVVLAGMGGALLRRLLVAGVPSGVRRLVLQPNTDWPATRRFIAERRWHLDDERLVEDRGKFYVVFAVTPIAGADPRWTEADLELGPLLRRRADPVWGRWLARERERVQQALDAAVAGAADDATRQQLLRRLDLFERR